MNSAHRHLTRFPHARKSTLDNLSRLDSLEGSNADSR